MAKSASDRNVGSIVRTATASPAIDSFLTYRIHANSQIRATITNWGYFGNFDDALVDSASGDSISGFNPAPALESPPRSGIEYLYDAGIWIGGIVNGDTLVSIGTRGSLVEGEGTHEFFPDSPTAPRFSDFDADEEYTASYSDTLTDPLVTRVDPLDGFHRPLPVRVRQTTRLVQDTAYGDAIVIEITVANVGPLPIQGLWLGWMIDPDICHFPEFCDHNGCYCSADDIAGFHIGETPPDADGHPDTVRAAWVADNDGNPDSTGAFDDESPTGAFASMYLGGTPRLNEESFNWWIDRFSRTTDWGPQHIPGDTNSDGGHGRPLGDHMKYRLMSNREIDYDQVYAAFDFSHVGWIKPPPDDIASVYAAGWDTRFLQTVGAVDLRPGDSIVTDWVFAVIPHWHTDPRHFHDTFDPHAPDTYRSGLNFEAMDSLLARMQLLWRHDYAEAGIGSPLGWGVASWTDSSAVLKWKPRGTRRLAGYRIERTLDTAGSDICRTDLPSDDSVATDRGLDRGSTYYYRIASVNQRDGTIGPPSCWINVLPDRPKIPRDLTARRGNRQIMLSWQSPLDTNVVNHRVYRENTGDGWDLIGESNVGSYTDQGVVNDTVYHYRITAVSRLGNESDPAGPVRGIAFAFDGLPLILDGTRSGPTALTDKDSVRAVWERLLEPLGAEYRDANPQTTNRFGLDVYGPHPAVVVVSDGRGALETSLIPQLGLYTYAGGALVISGRDLFNIPQLADGTMNFKPGAFAYDVLGITAAYYPSVLLSDPTRMNAQFAAALSADPDLPNLDVDPERTAWGLNPALPDPGSVIPFVGYFDIDTARARVLYTFESNCGDKSPLDGRPVAVISKDPDHPAAAFSFPLSYIREDLARRAILAVLGQLGWSTPIAGDANNDGRVDAADCLRLMNCLFRGAALRNLTHVDLNGDCEVNVVDLAILIDYTLHAGVLLESGCAVSGR